MLRIGLVLAGLCFVGACGAAAAEREALEAPQKIMKVPPPAPAKVAVTMTAATLAEDCGGTAPIAPPPTKFAKPPSSGARAESDDPAPGPSRARGDVSAGYAGRARMRCEQTSMQLSVIAGSGVAPTSIRVKKVELVDDTGKLIGTLTPSAPTVWSDADGIYKPWAQTVSPDTKLSVSYALSKPDWSGVKDRASHSYVLRAVIVVGGADQTVQREAHIAAPTIMPPNVRT
jgi:hypothetical protein